MAKCFPWQIIRLASDNFAGASQSSVVGRDKTMGALSHQMMLLSMASHFPCNFRGCRLAVNVAQTSILDVDVQCVGAVLQVSVHLAGDSLEVLDNFFNPPSVNATL
jgi:hypothetical protein